VKQQPKNKIDTTFNTTTMENFNKWLEHLQALWEARFRQLDKLLSKLKATKK